MEKLKSRQKTLKNSKNFSDHAQKLQCEIFGKLYIMCGAEQFSLPSEEELESLLANLDLFTSIEFEHLLEFIDRFLKRMAYLVMENIRHYLNHLKCEDTIEHFLETIGDELSKINYSYNSCPFESLLVMYLSNRC